MEKSYCATGRIVCPHQPQCVWECRHELAAETRKIKPYPAIPPDIEPVPDTWQTVGTFMLAGVMAMLVVLCALLLFTGFYLWGLLA